jgi:hypothetical protein
MDCYLALRRSSSSTGRADVTASRCHAATSNAVVDTQHDSVRDASVDGTTHSCQSGGTHEPRSTSPVRSSPRRLGLGDAIHSADAIRRDCATWASSGEWVGDEDRQAVVHASTRSERSRPPRGTPLGRGEPSSVRIHNKTDRFEEERTTRAAPIHELARAEPSSRQARLSKRSALPPGRRCIFQRVIGPVQLNRRTGLDRRHRRFRS